MRSGRVVAEIFLVHGRVVQVAEILLVHGHVEGCPHHLAHLEPK